MNDITFYIKEAFTDLYKNKGRTFLTSLGIIIGVYSVILLLSLGEGLKIYIEEQFASLGTNLVYVIPGKINPSGGGASVMGGKLYTSSDLKKLETGIPEALVVPIIMKNITLYSRLESYSTSMVGSTKDVFVARNLDLKNGRYFSKSEELSGRKVIVIGSKVAQDFFGKSNPIKQTIKIQNLRFTVVGVLTSKGGGGFGGPDFDTFVYTPYKAAHLFTSEKKFASFYLRANNKEEIALIVKKAERIMLKTYEEDDFYIATQDELISTISGIFAVINSVLVGIGAVSLLVGGIGITNIMYVTVTERTREIGIRRAIGAEETNILLQFLTSSVLLTTLGGILGIVLAYLTTLLLQSFFPATITLEAVIISFTVSLAIGVIFGVFPAKKAAKLSPVEAIRYE
jgi:putative ABC transport system permease protein